MKLSLRSLLFSFLLLALMAPASQAQQVVKQVTESSMEVPGMGRLISRMISKRSKTVATTYYGATASRTDDDESSNIMNLEDRAMYMIDHKEKAYYSMSFDDMMGMFKTQMAAFEQRTEELEQEMQSQENPDMEYKFKGRVEDLNETKQLLGREVRRYAVIIETELSSQEAAEEESVAFYGVSDMWMGENTEVDEMLKQFGERYVEEFGGEIATMQEASSGAMENIAAANPGVAGAMQELQRESEKMEGVAMEQTLYVLMGTPNMEFDWMSVINGPSEAQQAEVKEERNQRRRRGLGRLANNALRQRGINVGGGNEQEQAENAANNEQPSAPVLMMKLNERTTEISKMDDPGNLFEIPAGYKAMPSPLEQYMSQQENNN